MRMRLSLLQIVILMFLSLVLCKPALADNYYYNDEFLGANLDSTKWQSFQNSGNITMTGNEAWLRSGHQNSFPFIFSKSNPFPGVGDFSVEFKIQYTEATFWGTG